VTRGVIFFLKSHDVIYGRPLRHRLLLITNRKLHDALSDEMKIIDLS